VKRLVGAIEPVHAVRDGPSRGQRLRWSTVQIPATPPSVLKMIPESENMLACQSIGTQPPTVEPTNIPNQMAFFLTGCSFEVDRLQRRVEAGDRLPKPYRVPPAPASRWRSASISSSGKKALVLSSS